MERAGKEGDGETTGGKAGNKKRKEEGMLEGKGRGCV